MSTKELIEKIENAPPQIQKEVQDFLDFLLKKESVKKDQVEPSKKVRKAGFAKGTITYIADDFDAPLDDLKDYM